jgi:hypothetical protein
LRAASAILFPTGQFHQRREQSVGRPVATNIGDEKMAEELNYKGYRLLVGPVGNGWRVMIFPPGSSSALPESPTTLEKSPKEAIVTEAKNIVDARLKAHN